MLHIYAASREKIHSSFLYIKQLKANSLTFLLLASLILSKKKKKERKQLVPISRFLPTAADELLAVAATDMIASSSFLGVGSTRNASDIR